MLGTNTLLDPFCRPMKNLSDAQTIVEEIAALLTERQLSFRSPPPLPTTCCGRGCNGCVWQGYFEALAYWRQEAGQTISASMPAHQ